MPCSICKQQGHNRRSCPNANVTMRKTTTAKLKSMAKTFVSDDNDCCVCMNPIQTTNRCTTKCGHNFCLSCFVECAKRKPECPICRTKFDFTVPLPANSMPELGDDDFKLLSIGMFDITNQTSSLNDLSAGIVAMIAGQENDEQKAMFQAIIKQQIERKMLYWGYVSAKTMYSTLKSSINPTSDSIDVFEGLRQTDVHQRREINLTFGDTSVVDLTNQ